MTKPEVDWRTLNTPWNELLAESFEKAWNEKETPASWASPLELAEYLDPGYVARDHLRYLSDRLTAALADVEAGKSRYMLVSMPPRLGKSMLISTFFPAWLLHRHPDWPVMLLSHSPDLAAGWGRQVRRNVEDHPELGVTVSHDAGAATDWETTDRGTVLSKSIRQSITGRGARVMILDDVVKDFADAHSVNNREFVWDWWTANSRTRLHAPSLVVVVGTRWHEDDIIGRLSSDEYDGDPAQWEVISFPAIAEAASGEDGSSSVDVLGRSPGEPLLSPLLPDETPEQALARWKDIKQSVGSYAWSALFQQSPSPADGAIFSNDWWQFWRDADDLPAFDRALTSWDCAFKATDTSDFVVGQLWGVAGANRYLLKQVRRRITFTETLGVMREFISSATEFIPEGVHEHLVEDKANGTAVIDVLRSEIEGLVPVNPTESKQARARAVSPTVESGNVFLPAKPAWLPDFLSEVKAFPNGAHDDQTDALSQALSRVRTGGVVTPLVPRATVSRGFQRPAGASVGRFGGGRR